MPDPTEAQRFQSVPARDPLQEERELFRRNPPTAFGSTATGGGPQTNPALQATREAQLGRPDPTRSETAAALFEAGAATAGSVFPGASLAARLGSGMVNRLGLIGAQIVGRGAPAAGLGLLANELVAPEGETPQEESTRRNVSLATNVAAEALGPVAREGFRRALTPVRARLGGLGAKELLELGAEESQALLRSMGHTLTPGQLRTGKILDTLENVMAASFGGGQIMGIQKKRALDATLGTLDTSILNYTKTLSSENASLMLRATLDGSVQLDRAATGAAYRDLENKLIQAGAPPELVPVRTFYDEAVKSLGANPRDAGGLEILSSLAKHDVDPAGKISFSQAEQIRSDLLAIGRAGQGVLPSRKILANDLAAKVDQQIQASTLLLGRLGPEIVAAAETARGLSKFSHKRWDHELMAGLVDQVRPERLYREVLADDNPTQIRMLRDVLRDPRYQIPQVNAAGKAVPIIQDPEGVWNGLRSAWIYEQKRASGEMGAATLSGKALLKGVDDAKGTARELFSPTELMTLRRSARAIELIQKSADATKSGAIAIQLVQAGAAATVGGVIFNFGGSGTDAVGGALTILGAPAVGALLFTNPRFATHMMHMAQRSSSRVGNLPGTLAAQTISHLVEAKVPFHWQGRDGRTADYDPATNPAPTLTQPSKPQSKF